MPLHDAEERPSGLAAFHLLLLLTPPHDDSTPQERDEIFEEFQAACLAAGLQLRFLDSSLAALAGDEPLLLVIGADGSQLQRFSDAAAAAGDGGAASDGGEG